MMFVCLSALMGQKGQKMNEEIKKFIQDLAAGASIFIFLFFLYILMSAIG